LCENINSENFVLKDAVEYIHKFHMMNKHIHTNKTPTKSKKQIYLQLDQSSVEDYSTTHRSGWHYVLGGIKEFDAQMNGIQGNHLIFDDYIDKSFHWGAVALKQCNILPYLKPWAGFIHHTFHKSNGINGCYNLLTNACFLESLTHCKCILTMSNYMKKQWEAEFVKIGSNVPVHVIYHPTEFTEKMFTIDNFYNNVDRKIVQIGSWLRNPFPFYVITTSLKKAILECNDMNNVTIPDNLTDNMLTQYENNFYVFGLSEFIEESKKTVQFIKKLSNDDYDDLLSNNIVFLNLIDASAVNTVVECIVRNTVLIINRHPSIEEVLGDNYPGFYSELSQVESLCTKESLINIHSYLCQMDKSIFKLEYFTNSLQDILSKYA